MVGAQVRPSRLQMQRQIEALTAIVHALVRRSGGAAQVAAEVEMSGPHSAEGHALALALLRRMGPA